MTTKEITLPPDGAAIDPEPMQVTDPLGPANRLRRLNECLGPAGPALVAGLADALGRVLGGSIVVDRFSVQDRAAALGRPMVVAHLEWPRLRTRVALGVDPSLAHALADRLLGFERNLAELHLQVTPVEWGLLGFLAAEGLDWIEAQAGPFGPWDLVIDRVGPGPFEGTELGPIVTLRWRVRVGNTTGSARLWLPWALLTPWLEEPGAGPVESIPIDQPRSVPAPVDLVSSLGDLADLATDWRVVAGTTTLPGRPDGPSLRVGKILLIDGAPLTGGVALPTGPVTLAQDLADGSTGLHWKAHLEPAPDGQSGLLAVRSAPQAAPRLEDLPPADEMVLTLAIGSIRVRLGQLAGLRAGDVIAVDPIAIGRCSIRLQNRQVAVGELVAVDREVGVRIIAVEPDPGIAPGLVEGQVKPPPPHSAVD